MIKNQGKQHKMLKKYELTELFPMDYLNLASLNHLSSMEPSSEYMALKMSSWSSPGNELSFGISLAMVGQLVVENNCVTQTHTQTDTT